MSSLKEQPKELEEWCFHFGLSSQRNHLVPIEMATELMETIIQWAEANGCYVGGGFRPYRESEGGFIDEI